MHDVASLESLKVPKGHGKQDDLSMKVPAGQEPQTDAPAGEDSPGALGVGGRVSEWGAARDTSTRHSPRLTVAQAIVIALVSHRIQKRPSRAVCARGQTVDVRVHSDRAHRTGDVAGRPVGRGSRNAGAAVVVGVVVGGDLGNASSNLVAACDASLAGAEAFGRLRVGWLAGWG